MTAKEKMMDAGWEDSIVFENYSYDDALIGVSHDGRAIYDYDLMVECLVSEEGMTEEEAADWISYNTIRALDYISDDMKDAAPIVMYKVIT